MQDKEVKWEKEMSRNLRSGPDRMDGMRAGETKVRGVEMVLDRRNRVG